LNSAACTACGKLLPEIGTNVRVVLERFRVFKGKRLGFVWRFKPCDEGGKDSRLQVLTLHPNGISSAEIAVNTGLHPIQ
jgi:hypothetical protein